MRPGLLRRDRHGTDTRSGTRSLIKALDSAARALNRSRAEIVRQAVERYLEDFDDLSVALARRQDPTDEVLDWDQVKRELLDSDEAQGCQRVTSCA